MIDKVFHESAAAFLKEIQLSPPSPDSYETIRNLLETISEYREYAQPNSTSWEKYILDVYHILGFNTKIETQRLISLSEMGGTRSRRAIVILIKQDESFNDIVPGLEWPTFLFFALHFFQVDWGILTDGLQFRIFNRNNNLKKIYLHGNLEEILRENDFDSFFIFCNVISLIRGGPIQVTGKAIHKRKKRAGKYDLDFHLENKSNTVIALFEVLRKKIMSLSDQINEQFYKTYITYSTHKSFCQIRPQKNQIKMWVNLDIHQISDPQSLCRDVRKVGHYSSGKTEIVFSRFNELDGVFDIIHQAYIIDTKNLHKNKTSKDRFKLRNKFWTQLLDEANKRTNLHAKISPGKENWISTGAGKSGLSYNYVIRMNDAQVELYIDNGDQAWNKNTFGYFFQQKDEIERNFGAALDWQLLEDKRASRIRYVIYDYGLKDQAFWSTLQDLLIEAMLRFSETFRPLINQMELFNSINEWLGEDTNSSKNIQPQLSTKTELESTDDIPKKLQNVLMMYEEMIINNKSYTEAYKELTRRRGLRSEHTIPDSCTRGLGLNTSEFKALVMEPNQLVAVLVERFPKHREYISKTIL